MIKPNKNDDAIRELAARSKLRRKLAFMLISVLLPFSGYAILQLVEINNVHAEASLLMKKREDQIAQIKRQQIALDSVSRSIESSMNRFTSLVQYTGLLQRKPFQDNQQQTWKQSVVLCRAKTRQQLGLITSYCGDDYPLIKHYSATVVELLRSEEKIWGALESFLESKSKPSWTTDEDDRLFSQYQSRVLTLGQTIGSIEGGLVRTIGVINDFSAELKTEILKYQAKVDDAKRKLILYTIGLTASTIVLVWCIIQILAPKNNQPQNPKLILPK